jgi:hypothetical protein
VTDLAALRHVVGVDRGLTGGKRRPHPQLTGQAKIRCKTRTSCTLSVAHRDGVDAWRPVSLRLFAIWHSQ